jgi:hypothetical protein
VNRTGPGKHGRTGMTLVGMFRRSAESSCRLE